MEATGYPERRPRQATGGSLPEKNTNSRLMIVGWSSMGGTVETVPNPVSIAELAIDKQARTLLMPVSSMYQGRPLLGTALVHVACVVSFGPYKGP